MILFIEAITFAKDCVLPFPTPQLNKKIKIKSARALKKKKNQPNTGHTLTSLVI